MRIYTGVPILIMDSGQADFQRFERCANSIRVSEYFGKELGQQSLCDAWIPDGLKDEPAEAKA